MVLSRYFALLLVAFSPVGIAVDGVASYIESRGKLIELVSNAISPLDTGDNPRILTAIETDELIEPHNADRMALTARLIGWRREGDTIIIYRGRHDTETFPTSAMRFKFITRVIVDDCDSAPVPSSSDSRPVPSAS